MYRSFSEKHIQFVILLEGLLTYISVNLTFYPAAYN